MRLWTLAVAFVEVHYMQPAERGTRRMVKCLLDANADPNMSGDPYWLPLHAAAFRGNKDMVGALLDSGANVNAKGEQYSSAFRAAAVGHHVVVVKLVAQAGADVNRFKLLAAKVTLN